MELLHRPAGGHHIDMVSLAIPYGVSRTSHAPPFPISINLAKVSQYVFKTDTAHFLETTILKIPAIPSPNTRPSHVPHLFALPNSPNRFQLSHVPPLHNPRLYKGVVPVHFQTLHISRSSFSLHLSRSTHIFLSTIFSEHTHHSTATFDQTQHLQVIRIIFPTL